MGNQNFNSSIKATISVADAIKTISNVPAWWGVIFTGNAEKQGEEFVIKMSGDSFFNFTVTELVRGKKMVWLVTDCYMPWYADKNEWTGTRLIFELEEQSGETTVYFTHEGLIPRWIATKIVNLAGCTGSKPVFSLTSPRAREFSGSRPNKVIYRTNQLTGRRFVRFSCPYSCKVKIL